MLKKIIIISFLTGLAFAQSPAKKWVIIQDLQDRIVYLDTSAIKDYDNQISIWGLTIFRTPQRVTPFTEAVSQIKSNLLFNSVTSTYSVIGTLYYGKMGKIIGESSAPRITGGESNFELPIQPGSSIESMYQKAYTYQTTGKLEPDESEYLANTDFSKERPKKNLTGQVTKNDTTPKPTGPIVLTPEQNIAFIDEANIKTLEKRDSIAAVNKQNQTPVVTEPKETESLKTKLTPPTNKADLGNVKIDQKKTVIKKYSYDNEKDTNVRDNIWSDGIKYTIQLSSWREKDVAERLVLQKKNEGHDAFLMKVELPRRGTWYRVRIGYFDTLEEAQNYKRNNKL